MVTVSNALKDLSNCNLGLFALMTLTSACGGSGVADSGALHSQGNLTSPSPNASPNASSDSSPTVRPTTALTRCPSIQATDFNNRWAVWDGGGGRFYHSQMMDLIQNYRAGVILTQHYNRGKGTDRDDPALNLDLRALYKTGAILVNIYNAQSFKGQLLWALQSKPGEAVEAWAESILKPEDENGNLLSGAYIHALGFSSERMFPPWDELKDACKTDNEWARFCSIISSTDPETKALLARYPKTESEMIQRHREFMERLSIVAHHYKRLFMIVMHSNLPGDFMGITPEQYNEYADVLMPWSYASQDTSKSYGVNLKYRYKAWRDARNAAVTDTSRRAVIGLLGDVGRKGSVTYDDAAAAPTDINTGFNPHIRFYGVFGLNGAYWSMKRLDYNSEYVMANGSPLFTPEEIKEYNDARPSFTRLFQNLKDNYAAPTPRNDSCTQ